MFDRESKSERTYLRLTEDEKKTLKKMTKVRKKKSMTAYIMSLIQKDYENYVNQSKKG